MVWWLAAEGHTGPGPFYFTAPGTYTVGRKDCTITIQTDKSISRLHAEIVVDAAYVGVPSKIGDLHDLPQARISVKDLSKFGTFVNKDSESKPLNTLPNSTAVLKDGDIISFGINKALFRLQYLPMVLCMSPSAYQANKDLRFSAEGMGAYIFEKWNDQCTHLLVEEGSLFTDLVIAAVTSKKPVLSLEWLQAIISESSPTTQLPSLSRYIPTLRFNSRGLTLSATIAEPHTREETLGAYTIFLEKGGRYQHPDLLDLVNVAGGAVKVFTRDNMKDVAVSIQQKGLLILPSGETSRKDWMGSKVYPSIQHLHPMGEEDLLRSILTAKLDLTAVQHSPAASVDTDETVNEKDYQEEEEIVSKETHEIAKSLLAPSGKQVVVEQPSAQSRTLSRPKAQDSITVLQDFKINRSTQGALLNQEFIQSHAGLKTTSKQLNNLIDSSHLMKSVSTGGPGLVQIDEYKPEIVYTAGLVVEKNWTMPPVGSLGGALVNFKRFKKGVAAYVNDFSTLVPFAKDPYRESDYAREMGEYVKEERKRKESELVAEDLFNSERLKRRRATLGEATKNGLSITSSRK